MSMSFFELDCHSFAATQAVGLARAQRPRIPLSLKQTFRSCLLLLRFVAIHHIMHEFVYVAATAVAALSEQKVAVTDVEQRATKQLYPVVNGSSSSSYITARTNGRLATVQLGRSSSSS